HMEGVSEPTGAEVATPGIASDRDPNWWKKVRADAYSYNTVLHGIMNQVLTPTNQYLEANAPWKLVKTDKEAAKRVLFNAVQSLRVASILLKPFIPNSAEAI